MNGTCRLCSKISALQESHIIPKFIITWFKETSPTGKLRSGEEINIRLQDGIKLYWLCANCERRLGKWEKYFSEKLFLRLVNDEDNIYYDEKFLKFCVSISWRVLKYFIENGYVSNFSSNIHSKMNKALEVWKSFIFDEKGNPGEYEQHFFSFVGQLENVTLPVSKNIHRYLQRSIHMDVICLGENIVLVYTKLPNLLIMGYVSLVDKNKWRDTKINANNGVLKQRGQSFSFPHELWKYIQVKADHSKILKDSMSERQKTKINESYRQQPIDNIIASETFKSLDKDITLFGVDDVFESDDEEA